MMQINSTGYCFIGVKNNIVIDKLINLREETKRITSYLVNSFAHKFIKKCSVTF